MSQKSLMDNLIKALNSTTSLTPILEKRLVRTNPTPAQKHPFSQQKAKD